MTLHPAPEQLSAHIDGELLGRERATLETHLAGCAECAGIVAALQATLGDLDGLKDPQMDEGAAWSIRSGVARERRLAGRGRRRAWAAGAAAASVAGLLALTIASTQGRPGDGPRAAADSADLALTESVVNYDEASLQALLGQEAAGTRVRNYSGAQAQVPAGSAGGGSDASVETRSEASSARDALSAFALADGDQQQAATCLDTIRSAGQRTQLLEVTAARFKDEPVFLYFFRVPADKPERIELWVLTRAGCQVRYFRQAKISR